MRKQFFRGASAAVLALVFMGCSPNAGGGGGDGDVISVTAANLADMESYIASAAAAGRGTSEADPIVVAIAIADESPLSGSNGGGTDPLNLLYDAIPSGKYVAYDLSGCTFTSIGDTDYTTASARTNSAYLASVILPDTLTSIGDFAFGLCSGLTSVAIPGSVTSIGGGVFTGCTNLSVIQVSGSNTAYTAIEGVLFNKVGTELIAYPAGKGGSTYTIPNSVTSIGIAAFGGCSGLTSVTIPNSVASIGIAAFQNCSGLASVYVLRDTAGSLTTLGSDAFTGTPASLAIYVPASVVSNYKEMSGWSTYQNKIQQIP